MKIVFGFDMETDCGSFTPFYNGLVKATPVIIKMLKKNNITATFYFTGDSVKKHPKVVKMVKKAGFEVGCHTIYHETVGDPLFDIPGIPPLLPEEVENRLKVATEIVRKASGVRPVSFRAPRLFGSTAVVNALEKLGYVSDASYPMYYYKNRVGPYHPSRKDWTKKGNMKIVELPNFADLSMRSHDTYGRDLDQWPLFRTKGALSLMKHIDGFISYCARKKIEPFLCFYFHPWEFIKMPQGAMHFGEAAVKPDAFLVKNCGQYAVKQLDILIKKLLVRGGKFCKAKDIKVR